MRTALLAVVALLTGCATGISAERHAYLEWVATRPCPEQCSLLASDWTSAYMSKKRNSAALMNASSAFADSFVSPERRTPSRPSAIPDRQETWDAYYGECYSSCRVYEVQAEAKAERARAKVVADQTAPPPPQL